MKTSIYQNTSLTPHQQMIFDDIVTDITKCAQNILKSNDLSQRMISLSGPAGTGKTFLTTQIAQYFYKNEKLLRDGLSITAPTHKAVGVLSSILRENKINISTRTIHSFLGIKPFRNYETGEEKFVIDKTVKNYLQLHC